MINENNNCLLAISLKIGDYIFALYIHWLQKRRKKYVAEITYFSQDCM